MDSLSWGIPARFQKSAEATFNYPYNIPAIGHDERVIAVTLRRNVGHALAKSPVTMSRNAFFVDGTATTETWIKRLLVRRHKNVAAVALANKNARTIWALLRHDREYEPDYVKAAA